MTLHGEAVLLRPATMADAARLAEILAEPGVASWWGRHDLSQVVRVVFEPGRRP